MKQPPIIAQSYNTALGEVDIPLPPGVGHNGELDMMSDWYISGDTPELTNVERLIEWPMYALNVLSYYRLWHSSYPALPSERWCCTFRNRRIHECTSENGKRNFVVQTLLYDELNIS
jgi:hypothetical protein